MLWYFSIHSFICSFVRSLHCTFVRSVVRWFVRSFVRLFVRSFVRLIDRPSIPSFVRYLALSLARPLPPYLGRLFGRSLSIRVLFIYHYLFNQRTLFFRSSTVSNKASKSSHVGQSKYNAICKRRWRQGKDNENTEKFPMHLKVSRDSMLKPLETPIIPLQTKCEEFRSWRWNIQEDSGNEISETI